LRETVGPDDLEGPRLGDDLLEVLPCTKAAAVEISPNRVTLAAHDLVQLAIAQTPYVEILSAHKGSGRCNQ
jgi:hypothetical protein